MAKVGTWKNRPKDSIKGNFVEDMLVEEIIREGDIIGENELKRQETARDMEKTITDKIDRERE